MLEVTLFKSSPAKTWWSGGGTGTGTGDAEELDDNFSTQLQLLLREVEVDVNEVSQKEILVTNPVPVLVFDFFSQDLLRRQLQQPQQHHGSAASLYLTDTHTHTVVHNAH